MELRAADTRAYLDAPAVIVAVASWVRDLLVLNGVAPERIALIRQGVSSLAAPRSVFRESASTPDQPLRTVFVGRLDPIKGLELLLAAMRSAPDLSMKLDVLGSAGDDRHRAKIRALIAADPRVRLLAPIGPDQVVPLLARYDITVVPSQVLETGPLVVLESFAAGTPVLGSALGGIAELVRDDVDGRLVKGSGIRAWHHALRSIVANRAAVERWRGNVVAPRAMGKVSEEMESLYSRIVRHASASDAST
jgi:glycosyltransferase involved in cell wall biosynthesis